MTPGERTTVRIVLRDVAYAFPVGHRIRLAVSTAYWPVVYPAPEAVTLTLHTAGCRLSLPGRGAKPEDRDLAPFASPACARPPAHTVLRTPWRGRRVVERDVASGGARVVSARDRGMIRLDAIDLTHEGWGEDVHTVRDGDPLSARIATRRRVGYRRGDWSVRIETRMDLTSDRESFRLQADLDAFEGASRVFSRSWDVRIPRDGV
jgi:hypothetical protein